MVRGGWENDYEAGGPAVCGERRCLGPRRHFALADGRQLVCYPL